MYWGCCECDPGLAIGLTGEDDGMGLYVECGLYDPMLPEGLFPDDAPDKTNDEFGDGRCGDDAGENEIAGGAVGMHAAS